MPPRTVGRRLLIAAIGAASTVVLTGLAASPALAAAPPSAGDQQYMAATEQTNLAELSLGQLVQQRSHNQQSLAMATKTITDHTKAKQQLSTLAEQLHVTLPTAPNAAQQAQAAQLQAASADAFDQLYAQIQVTGHEQSIAATQQELATGSNAQVKQFASGYLPVAQMHLQMAQAELAALTGATPGVPAGSGGGAATNAASTIAWQAGLAAGLGLAVAGLLMTVHARRRAAAAGGGAPRQ